MDTGNLGQKKAGGKMQEKIVSDGQNRGWKILAVFLILPVTVCMNLSTSLHIISAEGKERHSPLQVSLTQSAVLGIPCNAVSRDGFCSSQPQRESKGDTGRCNALYCGGLGPWHKLYVFLLYIKGCLGSWVQKITYLPVFGDTFRDSYAVF